MKSDIICTCPLCLRVICDGVRHVLEVERRPLGAYMIRVIGGLSWVPSRLYAHLIGRMVESGELVKFVPSDPNVPTRYLLSTHLPTPRALAEREGAPDEHERQQW